MTVFTSLPILPWIIIHFMGNQWHKWQTHFISHRCEYREAREFLETRINMSSQVFTYLVTSITINTSVNYTTTILYHLFICHILWCFVNKFKTILYNPKLLNMKKKGLYTIVLDFLTKHHRIWHINRMHPYALYQVNCRLDILYLKQFQ